MSLRCPRCPSIVFFSSERDRFLDRAAATAPSFPSGDKESPRELRDREEPVAPEKSFFSDDGMSRKEVSFRSVIAFIQKLANFPGRSVSGE